MADIYLAQLGAEDILRAESELIKAAQEQLGLKLMKVRINESGPKSRVENFIYIKAELLPYSSADAKRLAGESGQELMAKVSEILANILDDMLEVNAMVGSCAAGISFEDIYRAKLYAAFDRSKAAQQLLIEYASEGLISSMSIENGAALCVFDSAEEMDAFAKESESRLNAEIVRRLMKADKRGFVKAEEKHVILSVQ